MKTVAALILIILSALSLPSHAKELDCNAVIGAGRAKPGKISRPTVDHLACLRRTMASHTPAAGQPINIEDAVNVIEAARPFIVADAVRKSVAAPTPAAAPLTPQQLSAAMTAMGISPVAETAQGNSALPKGMDPQKPIPPKSLDFTAEKQKLVDSIMENERRAKRPSYQSYEVAKSMFLALGPGVSLSGEVATCRAGSALKDVINRRYNWTRYADGSEAWIEFQPCAQVVFDPGQEIRRREQLLFVGGNFPLDARGLRLLGITPGVTPGQTPDPRTFQWAGINPQYSAAAQATKNPYSPQENSLIDAAVKDVSQWFAKNQGNHFAGALKWGITDAWRVPVAGQYLLHIAPGVGQAISICEGVSGHNFFTGDPLSPTERLVAFAGCVPGEAAIARTLGGIPQMVEVLQPLVRNAAIGRDAVDFMTSGVGEYLSDASDKTLFAGRPVFRTAREILDSTIAQTTGLTKGK